MKELEKIERISIATTLIIVAVVIGLLTYKRPENVFEIGSKQTLEKLISKDYFITIEELTDDNFVLIDLRSHFEFEKNHLKNAINKNTSELLTNESKQLFDQLKNEGKTIVLYANHPHEVNTQFVFLYQLGYTNLKVLVAQKNDNFNNPNWSKCNIEVSKNDIKAFISTSKKRKMN
jgi:rhodanese-related sulfurtransferase